jgi:GMP synthase (glutamine-hydrolysing)
VNCSLPSESIFELGIPILGICLGMQWIAKIHGGEVVSETALKGYGAGTITTGDHHIFEGVGDTADVWESHGDTVALIPKGFQRIALSGSDAIAGLSNMAETVIGLQFHPEVDHTALGATMLSNFLVRAGCEKDWNANDVAAQIRKEVAEAITVDGKRKKAILGLSGGVDSTVLAHVMQPVFEEDLLCIAIDSGYLREGELKEIVEKANIVGVELKIIFAAERFEMCIRDEIEPQQKRALFKKLYQAIFEEEAQKFGAEFIIQGSLATDFIESGKAGDSALIKSHHNIGIEWTLSDLHPLRNIFKHEVRELGRMLGLPASITERQPFPGPGLLIRVVGIPANPENVAIVRWCDAQVRKILDREGLMEQISQLVVALLGVRTVGVKGDTRSYGYTIVVRPIVTNDFMTVKGYHLSEAVIEEINAALTKHPEVTRVVYDYTSKPPATTEME